MTPLKRIYITGASGFIGSRLVKALRADGYEIGVLVRPGSGLLRNAVSGRNLSVYTGDIRDSGDVSRSIREFCPDAVIHLVTYYAVEHVPAEIGVMIDTNVKGTHHLLEAAKEQGVKLFVNASTCAVYRQSDRALSEDDPVDPQNLYAVTKLQAEEAVRFYALNYGVDGVSLRLFPPYGPGDHERRLIPYLIRSFRNGESPALTSGRQRWDFVFVDDVVDAFRAVLRSYPLHDRYDTINIGTGNPVSIRELAETVMRLMGTKVSLSWGAVPHRKNEVWFNSADIRKAGMVLGWSPGTGLDRGLVLTIDWFTRTGDGRN